MPKDKKEDNPQNIFHDQMLAKLALNYKLISNEVYIEAINIQKKEIGDGLGSTIHEVLIKYEFINKEEMELLHKAKNIITQQRKEKRFGAIAVKKGLLTESEIEEALKIQKTQKKEIGLILIECGLLSQSQREDILTIQKNISIQLPSFNDIRVNVEKTEQPALPLRNTFELNVSEDGLTAVLALPAIGDDIQLKDIQKAIRDHDICFGLIRNATIEDYLKYKNLGLNSFIVAKGENSVAGVSGELILHFTPRELKPGELSEDGTIDYKNRGEIPYVNEEDLLAERKIMTPSNPGTNVYGQMVEVENVQDVVFISGSGTVFNEAGDKIIAECSGEPFINLDGSISVLKEYRVDEVNYETGNIKFDGNIIIDGKVNSDFKVEGINITAREILGANIIAEGDVIVDQGIIGAEITAMGKVQATYIKDCIITCIGDVITGKEILDSEIETSGICYSKGNIISSKIRTSRGISSANIGSNISKPSHLEFCITKRLKIMTQHDEEKSLLSSKIEEIQEQKDDIKSMIKIISNIIRDIEIDQSNSEKEKNDVLETVARIEKKTKKIVASGRQRIDEISNNITAAKETSHSLIDDKTGYDEKLAFTEKKLAIHKEQLDTLNRKIKTLYDLVNENKAQPVIRVFDTIREGTRISSVNTALTLKKDFSDVSLKEVRSLVPESSNKYINKIEITRKRN